MDIYINANSEINSNLITLEEIDQVDDVMYYGYSLNASNSFLNNIKVIYLSIFKYNVYSIEFSTKNKNINIFLLKIFVL